MQGQGSLGSGKAKPLAFVAGLLVVAVAILTVGVGAASATLPQASGNVDLLTQADIVFEGAAIGNNMSRSMSPAGDVNGDGHDDVIVGAPFADSPSVNSGAAYVVFGQPSSPVNLGSLGSGGFRIDGNESGDIAGVSVGGAGDLNNDGFDDLVIGAQGADGANGANAGAAYVVFGKTTSAAVDLGALGSQGVRIAGASAGDDAGFAVNAAGDVDNDGLRDLIIGAYDADNNGTGSGSAYVVFGSALTTHLDLATLGSDGFRIDGATANDNMGLSVAIGGDLNADNLDDVVVGAFGADNNGRAGSGSAYVVFGKSSTSTVDLATLGGDGFRIDGAALGDGAAYSVSGAGDINADGSSDLVVGAHSADNNGRAGSGSAYVVFGKSSTGTVDLAALAGNGFRIDGAAAGDGTGISVSRTGDINGDGRPDLIVGSWDTNNNSRAGSGSATVVFGTSSTATIDLASLGGGGFRIDGATSQDTEGLSVGPAGDINGDDRPDVLTTAANANGNTGAAYVTYGFGPAELPLDPAGTTPTNDPADTIPADKPEPGPGACSRLLGGPTLYSVSPWERLRGGGRGRLRGPVGGVLLTSWAGTPLKLQTKQLRGTKRIKQVEFRVDGKRIAIDKRAPFAARLKTSQVKRGIRKLKVVVRRTKGSRTLSYRFFVTDCRPTKFSAAMSTKKPNRSPTLKLLAQTYGPELATASFRLPRGLGVKIGRRIRGKRIGTLRLQLQDGRRRSINLKLPAAKTKTLALASSGGVKVDFVPGSKRQLSVAGLPPKVSRLQIVLQGKRAGFLKNPRRCSRLTYRSALSDRTNVSLKLNARTRIC